MTIHYRRQGSAIIVFGNTYAVKDRIKALGGRFHGPDKNWRLPFSDSALAQIADLCTSFGGGMLGDAIPSAPVAAVMAHPGAASLGGGEGDRIMAMALPTPATPEERPRAEEAPAGLTIRQLMDRASQALSTAFPVPIWVVGEIQNLAQRGSGVFFDLAEPREGSHTSATVTARAILWSGALHAIRERRGPLTEVLQDGLKIRCLCQVQLYRDRGQISLSVEDIDPSYTKGALALAREKLLKELRAKGLDQAQKRLTLSPFPFRVGLISADGSRAKSDFLDQLWSAGFPGDVLFCAAAMQGESVPVQVVKALKRLEGEGVDVIVVTRGGGSAADLRWFDAPEIAYAIARCTIPVIAAIGHHDDVAVAEEICYLRQKTPTAAADFVASIFQKTRERIDRLATGLAELLSRRIDEFGLLTAALIERLAAAGERSLAARSERLQERGHVLSRMAQDRLHGLGARLSQAASTLAMAGHKSLSFRELRLAELERQVAQRDPLPWLEKGWTQLTGPGGLVRDIGSVTPGDAVHARLVDGRLTLSVTAKEPRRTPPTKSANSDERSS